MAVWLLAAGWAMLWLRMLCAVLLFEPLRRFQRAEPAQVRAKSNRKPAWAVRQLVLLKAHLPDAGCRSLALTFNRVFAHREITVSKSFVLRQHAHAVWLVRRAIRAAQPRPVAINHCWALDLTGRCDESGELHTILGILDHGSRRALRLARLTRPHQNLGGMTPLEAWQGINPFRAPGKPKAVQFVDGCDGLLAGFRIRG